MSTLDRFSPGLSVVFVRYDRDKHSGAWELLCRHLESVVGGPKAAVVVDNADESMAERRLNDWAVEIGGDNRAWEFSAFDLGVEWLRTKGRLHDLTLLVTDAFRAYGDEYLALVDEPLFDFCRRHSAAAGWVDSFMEPCRLLDVDYQAWFRTSCLTLPSNALSRLQPFAWPMPEERIFGSGPTEPWGRAAPLSSNLRTRIEDWLLAPSNGSEVEDASREVWHSRFSLDDGTSQFFRQKVLAILREHHLTGRLREVGVPAYDIRVLGDLIARGRAWEVDDSHCFFAGLRAWLDRDQGGEAAVRAAEQAEPKLVFAGDLGDATHAATVRGFSARVMPLVLQRFPRATFEVPAGELPSTLADLVGINRTVLRAPEWVMDAGGEGIAAVVTVGSAAPAFRTARRAERIDIEGLSVHRPVPLVAGQCCAALARAEERLVAERARRAETPASLDSAGAGQTALVTLPMRWRADYQAWLAEHSDELRLRDEYERELASGGKPFVVNALCRYCERETAMHVDFGYGGDLENRRPNWRERLVCQVCGLNSKMRGVLHVLKEVVVPGPAPRLLVWEIEDEMTSSAKRHFGSAVGVLGERELPVPGDCDPFDCLMVFDMFERTADLDGAIGRCLGLLKAGGGLAFSASFRSDRERSRTRPDVEAGGAGRVFGWSMLDRFRDAGFEDVVAHVFWSPVFGYLGVEQVVFVARKGGALC